MLGRELARPFWRTVGWSVPATLGLAMASALLVPVWLAAEPPLATEAADTTAPDAAEEQFLRIRRDKDGKPLALETAIVRYVPADGDGPVVDLIGAVHIGEATYYRDLNDRFASYDVVLYELVAKPEDVVPEPKKGRAPSAIGGLQKSMQTMLGLTYQLEGIDYSAKNFVHADMTPDEFAQSMKDRNESFLKMYFRMMGYSAARQGGSGGGEADLLGALFSKDRDWKLKRIMAEQLGDMEAQTGAMQGSEGSTILTERNKKALEVLRTTLDKDAKGTVGIFYGAAHLPDFEERLVRDFGLKRAKTDWLVAWALEPSVLDEEKARLKATPDAAPAADKATP